ncbi:MAG: hypothetical protein ACKVUT_11245 [Gaiella sp.]
MPCAECGASVAVAKATEHSCDPERRLGYQVFQLRDEVAAFGDRMEEYLSSAQGRFEQWYADRERRRRQGEEPTDEA